MLKIKSSCNQLFLNEAYSAGIFKYYICTVVEIIGDHSNFLKLEIVIFSIRGLKITTNMHTPMNVVFSQVFWMKITLSRAF